MGNIRRKPRKVFEKRSGTSPVWLTVYSDMMTNLMLFFLMLFAITRLSAQARARIFEAFKHKFAGAKIKHSKVIEKKKEEKKLAKITYVEETEERIKFTLPSPVLFDSGSANLKRDAVNVLKSIADKINETEYPVVVEGHTDNDPIHGGRFRSNWHLSSARAFSVLATLRSGGVSPERLSAVGYSEFRPIADNNTKTGKERNRRIEIILIKK